MARFATGTPNVPPVATEPADYPAIGRFFGRTGGLSTKDSNLFYTMLKDATAAQQSYKKILNEDPNRANAFFLQNGKRLTNYHVLQRFERGMANWRRQFYEVLRAPADRSEDCQAQADPRCLHGPGPHGSRSDRRPRRRPWNRRGKPRGRTADGDPVG